MEGNKVHPKVYSLEETKNILKMLKSPDNGDVKIALEIISSISPDVNLPALYYLNYFTSNSNVLNILKVLLRDNFYFYPSTDLTIKNIALSNTSNKQDFLYDLLNNKIRSLLSNTNFNYKLEINEQK